MSINQVYLCGNLGKDAELKYTNNGNPVSEFSVATSEYNAKTKKNDRVEWHRVILWGKLAEALTPKLLKGTSVFVGGKIATRSWEDKEGNKHYVTEIIAREIEISYKGSASDENKKEAIDPGQRPSGSKDNFTVMENTNFEFTADDIPF